LRSREFESLIERLANRGLDARFVEMGLDGAVLVLGRERDSSVGVFAAVRVLYITRLLNGTWRTYDLIELAEGYDESEAASHVERRLMANQ
jgi:hypothetical protein